MTAAAGAAPGAVVVGGGLAGIAAALSLADADVPVTLVEARPRLGGRAFSFHRGGLQVDNGHHVFLRCCTAYRALLNRIGAAPLVSLQDRLDVPVIDVAGAPGAGPGKLGRLRRSALPVPLHLAGSLSRYRHLSVPDRVSVARAALALRRLNPADPALDERTFASWLRRHGQSPRAIQALWDLVGVATLNATAENASLALAAMVFRTGLLSAPGAADIGWATVPLGALHDEAARAALTRAGVRVLLRTKVAGVASSGGDGYRVAVRPGAAAAAKLSAATVVLAVEQWQAHALLPPGALDDPGRLLRMRTAPILNVHVVYDRKVLDWPMFAALGSEVQWVFDRTAASGLSQGQYLALSQSAAEGQIELPTATLRERYLPELRRLLPAAGHAKVTDFFVTRERAATFAPAPGVQKLRPGPGTNLPGLYLAGAWTDTGWPATMEGAVRSGRCAARQALTRLGRPIGPEPELLEVVA